MILEWLISALEALVGWVAGIFPVVDVGQAFASWGLVTSHIADMNYFLPISELFAVVLAVFYVFPALMGVSIVVWLIALVRGGSARG